MVTVPAESQPPISVGDFARIHGVIRTVLSGADVAAPDIAKSCLFFAFAGAYLLDHRHGLRAKPVTGAAFFAVSEGNGRLDVLTFAKQDDEDGRWYSAADAFHAWVEVTAQDGQIWVVDFTSPLYPHGIRQHRPGAKAPFKAFIRPKVEMLVHPDRLHSEARVGDFFVEGNQAHTADALRRAATDLQLGDLIDVVNQWYVPLPAKMQSQILMGYSDAPPRELTLKEPRLDGCWFTQRS
ncbi:MULTISPECIES: DUF2026 family protein [Stenotrophomonas]|uniref:DUF2026 family protein n=1 Tax=Stenotrophomonas TaxID=40323 RepID=UPI000DA9CB0C|nr:MULTISPECIES: DUF2026 family protein [Stenotrophomonas]MCU1003883.1 DUF2026 family protein [Stenotrophomonas maltophilia]